MILSYFSSVITIQCFYYNMHDNRLESKSKSTLLFFLTISFQWNILEYSSTVLCTVHKIKRIYRTGTVVSHFS